MSEGKKIRREIALRLMVTLVPLTVSYVLTHPDSVSRTRMRTALMVKRHADWQADTWSHIATYAAIQYHRARI